MTEDRIQVTLTRDEALVLFEWLASLDENGNVLFDEAEQKVVRGLEGQLESELVEVLAPNYRIRLLAAKNAVLSDNK